MTATGRLSSSELNLQNIPIRTAEGREIREALVPEPGWKPFSADYSQIELRLFAHYSRDPGLISSFVDGADIHSRTAAQGVRSGRELVTPDQRRQAKAVNFGLMYGMSAFRLSNELKIPQRMLRGSSGAIFSNMLESSSILTRRCKAHAKQGNHPDRPHSGAAPHKQQELQPTPTIRAAGHQHADPRHSSRHTEGGYVES